MELRVLRYFLAVAQEGNISMAASRLHVGQPTLSRQIKELERELGQKLFVRQAHGIRLTDEGEMLRQYARQMVDISDKIERDFAVMQDKPLVDVYAGGMEGSFFHWAAEVMLRMRELYPNVGFHYKAGSFDDTVTRLERGLIDFGIVGEPPNIDKFESLVFPQKEYWGAYMRADNPLAAKSSLTATDLACEPLLMFDQTMLTTPEANIVAKWFGDYFPYLNVVATSNLSYTNSVMAQEGLGTLITWCAFARDNAPNNTMVMRPLDPPITSRAALIWSKERPLSRSAACYLETIKEEMQRMGHEE